MQIPLLPTQVSKYTPEGLRSPPRCARRAQVEASLPMRITLVPLSRRRKLFRVPDPVLVAVHMCGHMPHAMQHVSFEHTIGQTADRARGTTHLRGWHLFFFYSFFFFGLHGRCCVHETILRTHARGRE